jgi:hypothetical protein
MLKFSRQTLSNSGKDWRQVDINITWNFIVVEGVAQWQNTAQHMSGFVFNTQDLKQKSQNKDSFRK